MKTSNVTIALCLVLSMVASPTQAKPFLGNLIVQTLAALSTSTPDDPQSHISDFRKNPKPHELEQLTMAAVNGSSESSASPEPRLSPSSSRLMCLIARIRDPGMQESDCQRQNGTAVLARLVDDWVRPAQRTVSEAFQRFLQSPALLAPERRTNGDRVEVDTMQNNRTADVDEASSRSPMDTEDSVDTSELPIVATNGTLVQQLQERRMQLQRRVAKALSSITGLLILAANTRKQSKTTDSGSRSIRSVGIDPDISSVYGDKLQLLNNEVDSDPFDDQEPRQTSDASESSADDEINSKALLPSGSSVQTFGIVMLEVFGSLLGFTWGVWNQIQSVFNKM